MGKKEAELQPTSAEELRRQLEANAKEYGEAVTRNDWFTATTLSERTQQLTQALRDAHERSIGLNG